MCLRTLSTSFLNPQRLGTVIASVQNLHSRVVGPHSASSGLCLYPVTPYLLSWVETTVREPAEPDTLAVWKMGDLLNAGNRQNEKLFLEKEWTEEAIKQLRKGSEGLKVPGVFQNWKARLHSSHLYRSWTCKNQLPFKNKTQTNWKRTGEPRFMLEIAVTLNHWLEPLVCWKGWMWSYPSFSGYCSYSQRL